MNNNIKDQNDEEEEEDEIRIIKKKHSQLALLLWKNFKLQKRSMFGTVLEIFVPALFAIILLPIRQIVNSDSYLNDTTYNEWSVSEWPAGFMPTYDSEIMRDKNHLFEDDMWCFGYQPNNSQIVQRIMENVALDYAFTLHSFANENQMVEFLLRNPNNCLGGASFLNDTIENFTYKLRYSYSPKNSGENRLFRRDKDWKTNLLYTVFPILGPREKDNREGGDPGNKLYIIIHLNSFFFNFISLLQGYYREGFIQVQKSIDYALIKEYNTQIELIDIKMNRFPYPPYNDDKFIVVIIAIFPLIIMLSYIFTMILTAKAIVYEKETGLKEAMKLMGMKTWVYWLSWYIKTFLLLLPALIFMIVAYKLKLQLRKGGSAAIIDKTDPVIFTIFMLMYTSSSITFVFLCSTFFKKANSAAAGTGIIWFITYLPYTLISLRYQKLDLFEKVIALFVNNLAMSEGFLIIGAFEAKGTGLNWTNWKHGINDDDEFTFSQVLYVLFLNNFIHLGLVFYFEKVMPGNHGIAEPWYFPAQKIVQFFHLLRPVVEKKDEEVVDPLQIDNSNNNNEFFEDEAIYSARRIGIEIKNLDKNFHQFGKKKQAVSNLSLNVYEGQITVLLGEIEF
jgi:ATP-binding cassette, subfamily A (ABC1), member 3